VYYLVHTGMANAFGKCVREQREALCSIDPRFALRQVAARIGVEPSYLSKVERGRVAPPSESTVIRLAKAVALDPDELLALAGKMSADVRRTILKRPKLMAGLVRQFARVSGAGVQRVILRARRSGKQ
jgi:HTH-type transcriptional regulator, competence development regulator